MPGRTGILDFSQRHWGAFEGYRVGGWQREICLLGWLLRLVDGLKESVPEAGRHALRGLQ